MRRNKVQHQNEITFISLRIHPDTLNGYAELSTVIKVHSERIMPPFSFFRLNLTISKPEKQQDAELNRDMKALLFITVIILWFMDGIILI